MAIKCPICGNGTIKKGDKLVYCSERKAEKRGNTFVDIGCKFKIVLDQKKVFGDVLSVSSIKDLLAEKTIISTKGHKMTLDLSNSDFYTKIEFAEKKEDEDL